MRQKTVKRDGWYSRKSFAHFDLPLPFEAALEKVADKDYVRKKAHWPFIGFTDSKRRFRKIDGIRVADVKDRDLKYCSHVDGYIHSYYAKLLITDFEAYLNAKGLDHAVIGYRSGLGNNADLAKAAFDDIRSRQKCTAMAFDLKSFFDTIDHRTLKHNLCEVLGAQRLPPDWFNIYRSMTSFAWIELEELCVHLMLDKRKPPRPFCTIEQFRTEVRSKHGLIKRNPNHFGIPQGSPLSAVMSNVSMIHFDHEMTEYTKSIGASYRRYSDDILVICDSELENDVTTFIEDAIAKVGASLVLSKEKTEISRFWYDEDRLLCERPCTYLGFTFDGSRSRLRQRTLSRYFRRVTYATRHAQKAASKAGKPVFMRKLYRELSHLGRNNFYSYVRRSADVLFDDAPKQQLRRHMRILKRKVRTKGK